LGLNLEDLYKFHWFTISNSTQDVLPKHHERFTTGRNYFSEILEEPSQATDKSPSNEKKLNFEG